MSPQCALTSPSPQLQRSTGLAGALVIGLGSILGTGVFVSLALAAAPAGDALPLPSCWRPCWRGPMAFPPPSWPLPCR